MKERLKQIITMILIITMVTGMVPANVLAEAGNAVSAYQQELAQSRTTQTQPMEEEAETTPEQEATEEEVAPTVPSPTPTVETANPTVELTAPENSPQPTVVQPSAEQQQAALEAAKKKAEELKNESEKMSVQNNVSASLDTSFVEVDPGDSVTLTAQVEADDPSGVSYQWQKTTEGAISCNTSTQQLLEDKNEQLGNIEQQIQAAEGLSEEDKSNALTAQTEIIKKQPIEVENKKWQDMPGETSTSLTITANEEISTKATSYRMVAKTAEAVVATTNVDVRSDKLFSGGKGTKDNPYQIRTYDELWNVRNFMNNAKVYFLLLSDIDAAGKGWKSIGDYTKYTGDDTNRKFFMGNLDGNGFIIKNLNITETAIFHQSFITTAAMDDGWPLNGDISGDVQLAGLFGVTSRIYDPEAEALIGGTITNLGVKNVTIDLDYDNSPFQFLSGLMCGGLVARPAMCLIENCFVTGAMSGKLYGTTEWYNFDEATILSIGGIIAGFEKTGRKGRKEFYMPTDAVGTIENSYASVTTSADLKINRENAKKGLFESFEVVTKGAIKPQSEDKRIKVIHSYYDSTK
ncbi:MAG: hypothetical protein RR461_09225, partial [Angelakisella sp.]